MADEAPNPYTKQCYTDLYKVRPAFHNKNLFTVLNSERIALARHTKVRREGYGRGDRPQEP
jgi:hypothetical protein